MTALYAPAADRNKEPIFSEVQRLVNQRNLQILEIASGTGQHVEYMAKRLTGCQFTPSDIDESHIKSINKLTENLQNVSSAIFLDVSQDTDKWPAEAKKNYDLILCVNLIHISPWSCTIGLFNAASRLLSRPDGLLLTYGPYAEDGVLEPESNVRFDAGLRQRDSEWGVRDIRDLKKLADERGMELSEKIQLPANNKLLVWSLK